ncbi:type II toxin-antitoxin system VapC family toxin [Neorhizobium sp. BT27B]|uniref:type II toxin-antitoxin system VapC family toxin n=1 Tax=Neorhizobium sp. BT27B TaxID=3142625 RepID=UPI003D2D0322
MIAIDTNLVIRYLTGDESRQSQRSRQIINRREVFVPITVLLETEWVLKSSFRLERAARRKAISDFAGLPTVTVEERHIVAHALDLFGQGMDFADALHLLKARHCEGFATFDRKFVKLAQKAGFENVIEG